VTRALASVLHEHVSIVATDLNQSMLDQASAIRIKRPVEWRQADATHLPFKDGTFDAVVCKFGVMFFPDKSKAFPEAHRVLKAGGIFIFRLASSLAHRTATTIVALSSEISQTAASSRHRTSSRLQRVVARNLLGSSDCVLPRHTITERDRGARPLST